MTNVELHLFTNSTCHSPNIWHIKNTYESFCKEFNVSIIPTIWVDPNPNKNNFNKYIENLQSFFNESTIHKTESFSDGYIKAINNSSSDFLVMLEHDWYFLNRISHTLENILELMEKQKIIHFRFNKRKNIPFHWDKNLTEKKFKTSNGKILYYCTTRALSNNPHIIYKPLYLETAYKFIRKEPGSRGIEHHLNFNNTKNNITGSIYGNRNHLPTVSHLDGKNKSNKLPKK